MFMGMIIGQWSFTKCNPNNYSKKFACKNMHAKLDSRLFSFRGRTFSSLIFLFLRVFIYFSFLLCVLVCWASVFFDKFLFRLFSFCFCCTINFLASTYIFYDREEKFKKFFYSNIQHWSCTNENVLQNIRNWIFFFKKEAWLKTNSVFP